MTDPSKPLFSRPALAAVMLLSTLAIWLLNLTAPTSKLPMPDIKTWSTDSGIPVTWLSQAQWENSNKLEMRLVFGAKSDNPAIIQATLDLLLSDALPLSTASINQRLAPLAAQALSRSNSDSQVIGITVNSEVDYLAPTLTLMTRWLNTPDFKQRSFDRWQRQQDVVSAQASWQPFDSDPAPDFAALSLDKITSYYQDLKGHAIGIFIVGHMAPESADLVKHAINSISKEYHLSPPIEATTHSPAQSYIEQSAVTGESQSALALNPLSSVKEWLSLQIWGADLVATLNQQAHIDFVQLTLSLSARQPWAWWQTQYHNPLTLDNTFTQTEKPPVNMKELALLKPLPSTKEPKHFQALVNSFKSQLEQQTLSPTWWSDIATQVAHENGGLTLKEFAESYQDAIMHFTIEDYQSALKTLLLPSSYQEIQVNP